MGISGLRAGFETLKNAPHVIALQWPTDLGNRAVVQEGSGFEPTLQVERDLRPLHFLPPIGLALERRSRQVNILHKDQAEQCHADGYLLGENQSCLLAHHGEATLRRGQLCIEGNSA